MFLVLEGFLVVLKLSLVSSDSNEHCFQELKAEVMSDISHGVAFFMQMLILKKLGRPGVIVIRKKVTLDRNELNLKDQTRYKVFIRTLDQRIKNNELVQDMKKKIQIDFRKHCKLRKCELVSAEIVQDLFATVIPGVENGPSKKTDQPFWLCSLMFL